MIVMLKVVLDCDPDAAWHALRSPAALREVVSPWLDFASLEPQGFPDAVNQRGFPDAVLRPGRTYRRRAVYRFAGAPA